LEWLEKFVERDRGAFCVPHSSEERAIALFLQHLDRLVRQGGAGRFEAVEARIEVNEGEAQPETAWESFENTAAGGDDFAADAVTGDEALWGLADAAIWLRRRGVYLYGEYVKLPLGCDV